MKWGVVYYQQVTDKGTIMETLSAHIREKPHRLFLAPSSILKQPPVLTNAVNSTSRYVILAVLYSFAAPQLVWESNHRLVFGYFVSIRSKWRPRTKKPQDAG
jgi:hypothetical protein